MINRNRRSLCVFGVGSLLISWVLTAAVFGQEAATTVPANSNDPTMPQVARLLAPPTNLPNEAGQVWRTYDLSPYTRRITTVKNPEQAVVDWILRDTGTDLWFRQPLGLMCVTPDALHVYHTLEVQRIVAGMVDRLVESKGQKVTLGIRLVTVGRADWRAAAFPYLQPFEVQTAGVEGWLLSKENAAVLANQLAIRNDFRPLEVGDLILPEGQSHSFKRLAPQSYIRSLQFRALNPALPAAGGMYEPLTSRFEEGYTVDVSPLGMLDQRWMEVVLKCQIDQLEKLQTVTIPVPTVSGQMQNMATSVPQVVSWRLHERFRWPKDQVLLLSCGVIATPLGAQAGSTGLLNLGPLVGQQRGRADALLFVEFKGVQNAAPNSGQAGVFQAAPSTPTVGPIGGNPGLLQPGQFQVNPNPFQNPGGVSNSNSGASLGGPSPIQPMGSSPVRDGFRPSVAGGVPTSGTQDRLATPSGLYPIRR
ncbi:MAG: hypothetical protein JNL67_01810 [Planctomycetaceae bacterium]|nr:hypothetical protein [Planctomycetaceae bacterium]